MVMNNSASLTFGESKSNRHIDVDTLAGEMNTTIHLQTTQDVLTHTCQLDHCRLATTRWGPDQASWQLQTHLDSSMRASRRTEVSW